MATKTKTTKQTTTETTEQLDRATIVERIRKLLALAGNNPNIHEAAMAAAKAAELTLKYNIEQGELAASQQEAYISAKQTKGEYVANCKMTLDKILMSVVARHAFCRVVFIPMDNNHQYADVIGQPQNIEIVRYLYIYLLREIDRLARVEHRKLEQDHLAHTVAGDHGHPKPLGLSAYTRSFRQGAIDEITLRLHDQREAAEKAADTGASTMALVVRKDQEAEEALARLYPRLRNVKNHAKPLDGAAYHAGAQAGRSIPLNKAISDK